jgi:hypothetical protein
MMAGRRHGQKAGLADAPGGNESRGGQVTPAAATEVNSAMVQLRSRW